MRAGPSPSIGGDHAQVQHRVLAYAGGSPVDCSAVEVFRSIGGAGMPRDLMGAGDPGPAILDADVVPSSEGGMVVYQGSPWRRQGGFPVPLGTPLRVDTTEGDDSIPWYRQFTGVVTADSGDHTAALSLHAEDDWSWMTRTVSWPALWEIMPPAQDAPSAYRSLHRRVGVSHWYVLDRALRAAGRGTHLSDPSPNTPGLVVPFVDSAWPEKGTCWRAHAYSQQNNRVGFATSMDTRVLDNAEAVYAPSATVTGTSRYVSLRVGSTHSAPTLVVLQVTGGTISVRVTASRVVEVWGSGDSNAKLTQPMDAGDRWVHVRYSTDGTTHIRTATHNAYGSIVLTGLSGGITRVNLAAAPGSRVGGLIVTGTAHGNELAAWSQPAKFLPSTVIPSTLEWVPRMNSVQVPVLLRDGCESACLSWGVNADGVVVIKAPDRARESQSLTTTLNGDIAGALAWSRHRDTARHQVAIRHQVGKINRGLVPSITLWEDNGETMPRGHTSVGTASIPADEEWLACTELHKAGAPISSTVWGNPDIGQGTIVGGWLPEHNDWATTEADVTLEADPIAGAFTFTTTAVTAEMSLGDTLALYTAPDDHPTTTLPYQYRKQPLPHLRGWIKQTTVDVETRSVRVGPNGAPDLIHEASWWVQDGAQALAEWLAVKACPVGDEVGLVVFDDIPVRIDHRIEAGDVLTIADPVVTGLELTVLVLSVQIVSQAAGPTMSLGVEVIEGHSTVLTIGEVDAAYAGATIGDVDAAKAGTTLGEDTVNPTVQNR